MLEGRNKTIRMLLFAICIVLALYLFVPITISYFEGHWTSFYFYNGFSVAFYDSGSIQDNYDLVLNIITTLLIGTALILLIILTVNFNKLEQYRIVALGKICSILLFVQPIVFHLVAYLLYTDFDWISISFERFFIYFLFAFIVYFGIDQNKKESGANSEMRMTNSLNLQTKNAIKRICIKCGAA